MSIVFKDGKFYWQEGEKQKVLLDCLDMLSNKSRVPMHTTKEDIITIPYIIQRLLDIEINKEGKANYETIDLLLLDLILISKLIQTSLSVKVLEVGCGDGILSYHIATILGQFHPKSSLYCMSDKMEQEWLEKMSSIEQLPQLSFLASDYDNMLLQKEAFDIVILNGSVYLEEPYKMIKEVLTFVKRKGIVICYSNDMPLLESSFKLFFKKREEYQILPIRKVLVGIKDKGDWNEKKEASYNELIREHLLQMKTLLFDEERSDITILKGWIEKIEEDIERAILKEQSDWKVSLLELKEKMLDYMLCIGKQYETFYKREVEQCIQRILE